MQPAHPDRTVLVRVHGRVQGVGFRYWTRQKAVELGISGWVRNCADGSVEALLSGPEPVLRSMLERLQQGPVMARVERLDARWLDAVPQNTGFRIRHE